MGNFGQPVYKMRCSKKVLKFTSFFTPNNKSIFEYSKVCHAFYTTAQFQLHQQQQQQQKQLKTKKLPPKKLKEIPKQQNQNEWWQELEDIVEEQIQPEPEKQLQKTKFLLAITRSLLYQFLEKVEIERRVD
eukprot:TRINITY_DN1924_c0_g1_i2.p3 TRINITY_DN1924_c0_g1~~TRINITY_DN1924_c0_g1_i2.p3  ORF type:complete len:131 (-),score=23.90 TRINITY_DN1924_c0_g1_i2:82-474(-)